MKLVQFCFFPLGVTGEIRLSGGRRTSLDLQIRHWDSTEKTAGQIGSWSSSLGINITSSNSLEINHKGKHCPDAQH